MSSRIVRDLGVTLGLFLAGTVAAHAVTVSLVDSSTQGAGNDANVYAGTYDGTTPAGASWASTNPAVSSGNESGVNQSPFNNTPLLGTQSYFSVYAAGSNGGAPSPARLNFSTVQETFSLLWGSIDSYNTLAFYMGDTLVEDYSGSDIVSLFALGGSPSNYEQVALLNFGGELRFDNVRFSSTSAAFEFALPGTQVPEPATLALLGLGLLGLGAARRRK